MVLLSKAPGAPAQGIQGGRRTPNNFHPRRQAMMSCRFQSNYSSSVTVHGGPVMLRPVRATPCLICSATWAYLHEHVSLNFNYLKQQYTGQF